MADLTAMMQAAAGAAGGAGEYIEDVFSTYLYTGNGSTQTITNGIDLDGEGGLVWIKSRAAGNHFLYDTIRGVNNYLKSNSSDEQVTLADSLTAFNTTGFSIGDPLFNDNAVNYASWTFRKAPKFFDIVTYTGTGVARTVAHNLGSVPGCIIVKRTDTAGDWQVYHRANTANPETDYLVLNSGAATVDSNTRWNDTAPTSTVFTVGTEATVNASGGTYVAYLWAHDAGGFGDDGTENVVSCGSFTNSGLTYVELGYEPQWVLVKAASGPDPAQNWYTIDTMRGASLTGTTKLLPNTTAAESNPAAGNPEFPSATGMYLYPPGGPAATYIYIAIRRGPMKTPESGTEVFAPSTAVEPQSSALFTAGFSDMTLHKPRLSEGNAPWITDRLRGNGVVLQTPYTSAEATYSTYFKYDSNAGAYIPASGYYNNSGGGAIPYALYAFRRAPGFFDVVAYTGTGSATTFSHNLGVVPELMIMKKRSATDDWAVYAGDNTDFLLLNTTAATADDNTYWNDTTPTSSVFSVGTNADVNTSAATYVAYLFASLAGVSKVGSYTGNGTSVSVTTGFQPRFILVKRTDSTGNWYVGDSARGLVAGDDPFLELNTTDAEVTNEDWVDVSATGFTINETAANANVDTGTYIYLAIS